MTNSSQLPALEQPAPKARPSLIARLKRPSSLITLAVLGVVGWQWYDLHHRIDNLTVALAGERSSTAEARMMARQTQDSLQSLQGKVGALGAQVDASQSQQLALESLYQELSRSRDERVLAEVEQSLAIAAQQLQLAGNVEAALIALQGAEARLGRAAQPQMLPLRKLIARDIDRLKAMPNADISGIAIRLEAVVTSVDTMPLAYEQRPATPAAAKQVGGKPGSKTAPKVAEPSWLEKFGSELWAEVRQLVRIERVDRSDPALLAPDQAFFLRENLKLRLINARLALLARDSRSFHEDMRQAEDWLGRYFDTHAKPVQGAQSTVHGLAAIDIARDLPNLDETLNAVRNVKLVREKR